MNFVIIFILLLIIPELIPDSDLKFYVFMYCYRILIPITGFYLLSKTKQTVKLKSIISVLLLFVALEAHLSILNQLFGYDVYNVAYILSFFVFLALYLSAGLKRYSFKSDKIERNNVYLCFYKPVTVKMILGSLIGFPFGGMSIYINGFKYGYQLKKKSFKKIEYTPGAIQKKFVVVDTGILYNTVIGWNLDKLVGTQAGKRINCIWTIKDVLNLLGNKYKPEWWELIPPIYANKVML